MTDPDDLLKRATLRREIAMAQKIRIETRYYPVVVATGMFAAGTAFGGALVALLTSMGG